jgi:hypothetical protein
MWTEFGRLLGKGSRRPCIKFGLSKRFNSIEGRLMEAGEPMTNGQDDLFSDVPYDGDLVGPEATVHDLLKAKGRHGAAAYAFRCAPEAGRRAPVDVLAALVHFQS